MAFIHHNGLRVNAEVPDEIVDIWTVPHSEGGPGWRTGLHKDSDPDDRRRVPDVLPVPESDPEPPAKAKAKADTKES